jgi:pimeloyl-ACP methyl ester carboxylesterase
MCALDTTDRLSTIQVPAMVIATPDDPGAPREVSEKMARLIPDCQLHWLEPAQHLASLEHPERFNTLMRNFLLGLA